jgi:hypothetical protein
MSNTCLASEERSTTDRHPSDNLRARSDYFLVVVLFEFEPATQSYPVLYRNPNLDSRTRTSTGTVAETATRNESNLDIQICFLFIESVVVFQNTMPPTATLATAAKTPHRRRRRVVAKTPNDTDKENHQPAGNVADQDFGAFASLSCGDGDSDTVVTRALRLFHASQERTSSSTTSALWKEHSEWSAECVVRASLLLSTSKKAASGVVYLEEHAQTLLSTSRKLIKEATESKEVLSKLDHLLVAVHTLRALAPILEESSAKLETRF